MLTKIDQKARRRSLRLLLQNIPKNLKLTSLSSRVEHARYLVQDVTRGTSIARYLIYSIARGKLGREISRKEVNRCLSFLYASFEQTVIGFEFGRISFVRSDST